MTFDEKPLAEATVSFANDAGDVSYGVTNNQGDYQLGFGEGRSEVPPGEHRVQIETARVRPNSQGEMVEHKESLPTRYNLESELTATVVPGTQTIDFHLTSEKEPKAPSRGRATP